MLTACGVDTWEDMYVNVSKEPGEGKMQYDEHALMDDFDKWKITEKRERFLHRMEHKLNAKERRMAW
jgi:hypothetical protein